TCVNVAFALTGAYFSLLVLAQLLVLSAANSAVLWLTLAKHQIGFRWVDLFKALGRSAIVAIAAVSVPFAVTLYFGWRSTSIITTLSISIPGAAIGFLMASYLSRHVIWDEISRAAKALRA
ncbi:MAG: hypothetical protein ABI823_14115, partial [Bryobacteraceae bacterium]